MCRIFIWFCLWHENFDDIFNFLATHRAIVRAIHQEHAAIETRDHVVARSEDAIATFKNKESHIFRYLIVYFFLVLHVVFLNHLKALKIARINFFLMLWSEAIFKVLGIFYKMT